jgi:two-component system sensor histidine kinase HupT/HoxJ
VNCAPRLDHNGRRVGTVLTGRPVGEAKRAYEALHSAHLDLQTAQDRLVEQEKMASLGRLVAGVAQELNNPISFVYGNIHTLERYRKTLQRYLAAVHDGAPPEETGRLRQDLRIDALLDDLAPLIEGTLEGAERISEIVKNLRRLSFSRGGDRRRIDLARLLGTASHWATRSKHGCARITVDGPFNLSAIGHEGQIHQVLVNLVDNALDAVEGHPDPLVALVMREAADQVVIEIADNGPGIPEAVLDKIFEPFFTTKPVGRGTGLGLWISWSIARDHGGTLTAANRPEGGAMFTLRLPTAPA